jgi:hypothetical protein
MWEWAILVALVLFVLTQLALRLSGRSGSRAPGWVDAPPYFPSPR